MTRSIRTKYFGPTNFKGSRIKATSDIGISITIPYPYELSGVDCHKVAVDLLCKKLNIRNAEWINTPLETGYIFIRTEAA